MVFVISTFLFLLRFRLSSNQFQVFVLFVKFLCRLQLLKDVSGISQVLQVFNHSNGGSILLLDLVGNSDCVSPGKDFLEQKSLLSRKVSGMSPECLCDTSLPSDIGKSRSAELQGCSYDEANNMESVCYNLSIGGKDASSDSEKVNTNPVQTFLTCSLPFKRAVACLRHQGSSHNYCRRARFLGE